MQHNGSNGNGNGADSEDVAFERNLERRVIAAEAKAADAKIALREAEAVAKKYRKMLDLLRGEDATVQSTAKRGKATRANNDWTVSEEKVHQVWQLIKQIEEGDGFKVSDLHGHGVSTEAIRRSVLMLRERELIRKKGSLRGGGTLWALMPEARDVDDPAALRVAA